MFKRFSLLVSLLFLAFYQPTVAQSLSGFSLSSLKNINVSSIPESTIKSYAAKINEQGLSLDEVLAMAKEKGASSSQISQLRSRLSRYVKSSKSKENTSSNISEVSTTSTSESSISKKEEVQLSDFDKKIFGYDIFNKKNLNFTASTTAPVPDSYIVGIGDRLVVNVYGRSENSFETQVASNGCINLSMVGDIKIAGLKLAEARSRIMTRLRNVYADLGSRTFASVSVEYTAPITVNVMGEAYAPGTYTVSATASLFNVLYLCGGPNSNGSYRDIQLIRAGKIIAHLDVYDFILNGKTNGNIALANGDIVLIPTYQKRVSVGGQFKRSGYFEAKEGETAQDLINYAGGFDVRAMQSHMGIFRIGKYALEYKEISDPKSFLLANGDSLYVASVSDSRMDGAVHVSGGGVRADGYYEYIPDMKLSQLIAKAGGLIENAFTNRGVITRLKEDFTTEALRFNVRSVVDGQSDLTLKDGDHVYIGRIDSMRQAPVVKIFGEIKGPGEYSYSEGMTISDLIVISGGLTENSSVNNVEVARRLSAEERFADNYSTSRTNTVNLSLDLSVGSKDNDFALEPFDEIFIRTLPANSYDGQVLVSGACLYPGSYSITGVNFRISDLLERCGGLSDVANSSGVQLYRKINLSEIQTKIRLRTTDTNTTTGAGDTIYYLRDDEVPYEKISVNTEKILKDNSCRENFRLQDGDILSISEQTNVVRVGGNVQNVVSLVWQKGWNAKDYIKHSGGFAPRSFKRKTYVIYPDGTSASVGHILFFRRYPKVTPGSEVVVPLRPQKDLNLPVYTSVFTGLISSLAVIVSLTK